MMNSKLFTPASIGPLTLRNRTIRSAAFESMCPGNASSRELKDYHCSVAAGWSGNDARSLMQQLHRVAFLSTGNCGCALKLYRD